MNSEIPAMQIKRDERLKAISFYSIPAAITIFSLLPVYSVRFFSNNDGSGHLYIGYVMRQLIAGNDLFSRYFEFNSFSLPNSTGHWLIALFLGFMPPEMVTKLMLTVTFLAFFISVLFLRHQVTGKSSPAVAALFAGLLSLNWFWFQGGYNQTLAAAGFAFGIALAYRWRENLSPFKASVLSIVVLFVYFSHLVSFVILVAGILVIAAIQKRENAFRSLAYSIAAIIPALPLLFLHIRNGNKNGEPFIPHWRGLDDWYDPMAWLRYFSQSDPFALASRKSLPFIENQSQFFALISPLSLLFIASLLLVLITFFTLRSGKFDPSVSFGKLLPMILFFLVLILAAFVGPGDFGIANGSVLRERFLIGGLTILVAIFDTGSSRLMQGIITAALSLGLIIQTAFLFEFARYTDLQTREFVSVADALPNGSSLASVIISPGAGKFRCLPATQMSSFMGVNRNVIVWDNYELGHYLFPVIAKTPEDKDFAYRLSSSAVFGPLDRFRSYEENLAILQDTVATKRNRIDYFVVFGNDPEIDSILLKYYDVTSASPVGEVRVLKRFDF